MPRRIEFTPAYDRVNEGYGIHGVDMQWLLEGPKGVIQFIVFTNWHLPETQERLDRKSAGADLVTLRALYHPQPAGIGYHSYVPLRDWQKEPTTKSCKYLDGAPCYYDGSILRAESFFKLLVEKGHKAVWQKMEDYYQETFGEPSRVEPSSSLIVAGEKGDGQSNSG